MHAFVRSFTWISLKKFGQFNFFRESKISFSDERRTKVAMTSYSPIATFAGEFGLFNIEHSVLENEWPKPSS